MAAKGLGSQGEPTTTSFPLWNMSKKETAALTQWLSGCERRQVHQKAVGSIPGQGTSLGCGSVPRRGMRGRQPIDVSHIENSLSPHPSSLSKSNKNKFSGEGGKKERKRLLVYLHTKDGVVRCLCRGGQLETVKVVTDTDTF